MRRSSPPTPRIVYEDDDLVVADKPAGLLTVGTRDERHKTLLRWLFERERERRSEGRAFVVHRLDRDASGLVVAAKHESAKRALQTQFKSHTARRGYRALVRGDWPGDETTLRANLMELSSLRVVVTRDTVRGRPAVTHVRVVERGAGATLVELELETGRKHQIRVQLAHEGHPILGDRRYGDGKAGPLGRLALHATRLELDHPGDGRRLVFESPCPRAFARVLRTGAAPSPSARGRPRR